MDDSFNALIIFGVGKSRDSNNGSTLTQEGGGVVHSTRYNCTYMTANRANRAMPDLCRVVTDIVVKMKQLRNDYGPGTGNKSTVAATRL